MQPTFQTPPTAPEASSQEKFNLQLPSNGQILRVQLRDTETLDKKAVRIGNVSPLDWLFGKRG